MRTSWFSILTVLGFAWLTVACSDLLGTGGDGGPPVLKSVVPSAEEMNVSVLTSLTLRFSTSVQPATVAEAVSLRVDGRPVALDVSRGSQRTFILSPTDPLDFGTDYQVVVSQDLMSRGGKGLPEPQMWGFRTEGLPPPSLDLDSLEFILEAFAHDTMRGRGAGSPDEYKAALFLRDRFLAYGLQEPPGGVVQSFEAFARRLDRNITSQNVLAAVPGSGSLAQEWVVVGAHYDAVGFRGLDDESQGPNNGADDNGSGTMMVLEMARAFNAYVDGGGMGSRDRRSVLFVAFGAEEQGLLGSCHYVHAQPAVPLTQTRAMMNFDMVGRLRNNAAYVSGGETSKAWDDLVRNANSPGINVFRPETSCTGCTDHACFWARGIPFVGFFTGLHEDYHTPTDDAETVDFEGMGRIGDLSLRVLSRLVVTDEPPPFSGKFPS